MGQPINRSAREPEHQRWGLVQHRWMLGKNPGGDNAGPLFKLRSLDKE